MAAAVALALAWASVASATPGPDATTLRTGWEAYRAQLDRSGRYPFTLDDEAWARLAAGEVTKRRDRLDGTDRVLGVKWIDASLDLTWIAIQDPHDDYVANMVYEDLPGSTLQERYLYQRIGLPWPLADRQWVILVRNNPSLWQATGGLVWERTWDLSDKRGAAGEKRDAVWLTVNEGGWFLASVAGGTLLGYHVRTAIGGIVPDEAAIRWSFSTLDGMLTRLAARATEMRAHYTGAHAPLMRPDGSAIPVFAGP